MEGLGARVASRPCVLRGLEASRAPKPCGRPLKLITEILISWRVLRSLEQLLQILLPNGGPGVRTMAMRLI
jgi:hypothetical protein